MGLHNPLPSSFKSECNKVAKILGKFSAAQGSKYAIARPIPPEILQRAKGLAVMTVVKFAFIGGGRGGSGLLVARLPNGEWSAPSAIGTVGAGIGGQIGLELTDFVFVLNDASAVKTLAEAGSLTLGTNVSVAAGPVGKSAEAAGAASTKGVAGIFAYSDTKGLFAGVSLEGSGIIERRDENSKFYGRPVTAKQLLTGDVQVPPDAAPLMSILNSPVFRAQADSAYMSPPSDAASTANASASYTSPPPTNYGQPSWQDKDYDRPQQTTGLASAASGHGQVSAAPVVSSYNKPPPPPIPPHMGPGSKKATTTLGRARAEYNFAADQPGDLAFRKSDIIEILEKTDGDVAGGAWWKGRLDGREGSFPSNYVTVLP